MILEILNQLESTTKKLEKEAILLEHKDNELLKSVLVATLDPNINYYIKKIPEPNVLRYNGKYTLENFLHDIKRFSSRELTGNEAIDEFSSILGYLSPNERIVAERIIQRDLRCGVAESTVNKIWKGLIPEYPVMLASSYNEKNIKNIKFPALSQMKCDGMRINIHYDSLTRDITIVSRNGKEFPKWFSDKFADEMYYELGMCDMVSNVFDGEALVYENGNLLPRKTGNGILQKVFKNKVEPSEIDHYKFEFVLWDIITKEAFDQGVMDFTYSNRSHNLETMLNISDIDGFTYVEERIVHNIDEAKDHFNEMIEQGYEGTILKNVDHIWEDKRSKNCVKMKQILDADLKLIELVEGSGKYTGKLGAFILQTSDGELTVNCGSGFSDEQREIYWLHKDSLVGSIVEIEFNGVSRNKKGEWSLFLPTNPVIRVDKTVAESLQDLINKDKVIQKELEND